MLPGRTLGALAMLAALGGCAGSAPRTPPPARSAAADADLRKLVLDAAASDATCKRLQDRFIGLPAEHGAKGAAAGSTPLVGRWWIRACAVKRAGDTLRLQLSGPAWYRVDRAQSGYALHQYVYFDVDASLQGALDIGYDPRARLASIWFSPTDAARVRLRPLGELDLHARSILSWLALPVARAMAPGEVAAEGEALFRKRLGAGMTLTVDVAHGDQIDLLPGQLASGQAPLRPFSDGAPWLANERVELSPGGLAVDGPFPPQKTRIDARLESGDSVSYALVCARDLQLAFNGVARGDAPALPARAVFQRGSWVAGAASTAVQALCPWYLVTATHAPRALLALCVRDGQPGKGNARSEVVRLTLLSFDIDRTDPHGNSWDAFGGAPDPEIVVEHDGQRTRLFSGNNLYRATPDVAAPDPFEITPGAPLHIIAIDRDVALDDSIGSATLGFKAARRGGQLVLSFKRGAKTTGHALFRVDIVH